MSENIAKIFKAYFFASHCILIWGKLYNNWNVKYKLVCKSCEENDISLKILPSNVLSIELTWSDVPIVTAKTQKKMNWNLKKNSAFLSVEISQHARHRFTLYHINVILYIFEYFIFHISKHYNNVSVHMEQLWLKYEVAACALRCLCAIQWSVTKAFHRAL